MAIDFTKPALTDNYTTAFVPNILANQQELARMLDSGLVSITGTPPTGAKRYNRASSAFEEWSGSAWVGMPLQGIYFNGSNVGINAPSPSNQLHLRHATNPVVRLESVAGDSGYLDFNTTRFVLSAGGGYLSLVAGNAERLRVAAAGALTPGADNTQGLGSAALRWSEVNALAFRDGANGTFLTSTGSLAQITPGSAWAQVAFHVNNVERARLDSNGTFIVNATSRGAIGGGVDNLAVNGSIGLISQINANPGTNNPFDIVNRSAGGTIRLYTGAGGVEALVMDASGNVYAGADNTRTLGLTGRHWGTVYASALQRDLTGDLTINAANATGAIALRTGGAERARIDSGGALIFASGNAAGGVKLPNAANSDAQVMDWFQEGSWTPTVVGATTAGAASSYPIQSARYLRFGRLVYVEIELQWSGHTGAGVTRIQGLPWAAAFSRKTMRAVAGGSGLAVDAWTAETVAGQTYLQLYGINQNTGANSNRSIAANDTWWIQGFYEV